MASSRLTEDGRQVIVTSPGVGVEVGYVFHVVGDSATYGVEYADWVLRICAPPATNGRYMDGDSDAAVERIKEALTTGVVHGSLITPGPAAKYA